MDANATSYFSYVKGTLQLKEDLHLLEWMGVPEEPTKVEKRGRVNSKYFTISEMPILDYH